MQPIHLRLSASRLPLIGAGVVCAAVLLLSGVRGPATTTTRDPAAQQEHVQYRGTVTGWSILADGTLRMRMLVGEDQQPRSLWFTTAPDLTETTQFEFMVLEAILESPHGDARGPRFTVRANTDEMANGESADHPLELISVSELD